MEICVPRDVSLSGTARLDLGECIRYEHTERRILTRHTFSKRILSGLNILNLGDCIRYHLVR
jgi:hypothetical protein